MIKVVSNKEQTATGPLPITLNSDGTPLDDYKLYGTADGAGVETENLWNESWANGLYNAAGVFSPSPSMIASNPNEPIPVQGGTTYYIKQFENVSNIEVFFYSKETGGFIRYDTINPNVSNSFVTPQLANYIRFDCYRGYGNVYANDIVISAAFPTAYIPYGYKLPMTVMSNKDTGNMLNPNEAEQGEGYVPNTILTKEGILSSPYFYVTEFIPVKPNSTYWLFTNLFRTSSNLVIKFYQDFSTYLSRKARKGHNGEVSYEQANCDVFTIPSDAHYLKLSVDKASTQNMLIEADAFPPEYIPYHYSTVIPIYIGSTKLGEEEYVDYESGKIYRKVDGVLQPTDPPVALPELSTYLGENALSCSEGLGDESQITYVGPVEETITKIMRTEDNGQGNVTEHVLYKEGS